MSTNAATRTETTRKTRKSRFAPSVVALAALLAGCGERPLSTMEPNSDIAAELNTFLMALLVVCGVVLVVVVAIVLYMSSRFRVKAPQSDSLLYPDDEFPDQVHGHTRLEIAWTLIPTAIMAAVAFFTMGILFRLDDVEAVADRQVEKVVVVGQQWWWEFQYHLDDDGIVDIVTAGELVLPVDEEVRLEVTSRDVVHSFWIPQLNGKRDAVPGRISSWTIEVGAPGRYNGECTEFCGLSHAYMEKWAIGLPLDEWKVWAERQKSDAVAPQEGTAAAEGRKVFENNCASCHRINGLTGDGEHGFADYDGANRLVDYQTQVAGVAPNLTHLGSRSSFAGGIFDLYKDPESVDYLNLASDGELNRGQFEAWIRNAPEQKPSAWNLGDGQRGMTPFLAMSDTDLDNLVEFLMTLD